MRSRVVVVASAVALVDVAIIVFALVASEEGSHLISLRVWNLLLAIGGASVVVAVNAWSTPAGAAEQHYSQGVSDTINSGVVQMRHGNP